VQGGKAALVRGPRRQRQSTRFAAGMLGLAAIPLVCSMADRNGANPAPTLERPAASSGVSAAAAFTSAASASAPVALPEWIIPVPSSAEPAAGSSSAAHSGSVRVPPRTTASAKPRDPLDEY
jgi:hypothetical protein